MLSYLFINLSYFICRERNVHVCINRRRISEVRGQENLRVKTENQWIGLVIWNRSSKWVFGALAESEILRQSLFLWHAIIFTPVLFFWYIIRLIHFPSLFWLLFLLWSHVTSLSLSLSLSHTCMCVCINIINYTISLTVNICTACSYILNLFFFFLHSWWYFFHAWLLWNTDVGFLFFFFCGLHCMRFNIQDTHTPRWKLRPLLLCVWVVSKCLCIHILY